MKFLLDTCTLLWLECELSKVPGPLLRDLRNPSNELYLSPAAAWEITLKWQAGKLALPVPPGDFLAMARSKGGIESLPIEESAMLQLAKLPPLHADPFDRILICQAIDQGMAIVTPDPLIHQYPVRTVWK